MRLYLRFLKEMFLAAPAYVIGYFINSVLAISPIYLCNVYFLKLIIDKVTAGDKLGDIIPVLILVFLYRALSDAYNAWYLKYFKPMAVDKLTAYFSGKIRTAIIQKELYLYDNPEYHNEVEYITSNTEDTHISVLANVADMCAYIINMVLIINLFWDIGLMLILLVSCAVAVVFLIDKPISEYNAKKKFDMAQADRKRKYFFGAFFTVEAFKERKTSDVDNVLASEYEKSCMSAKDIIKAYGKKLARLKFLKGFISETLLMKFVLIAYLIYEVKVTGRIAYGDFAAGYNGINTIISSVMALFGGVAVIRNNNFFIKRYYDFMEGVEVKHSPGEVEMAPAEIELKNISFSYPGTDKEVLHNISMKIKKGEKIAIVGRNGSGKSTLVHLLMGLYKLDKGKLLVDGVELPAGDKRDAFSHSVSAFFQGEKLFAATIAENVALDVKYDEEKVEEALWEMGCRRLEAMPVLATMVGRELHEDGLILSGGETQKLMLSHCVYSDNSIVILDEPSSALDPLAERELNRNIFEAAKDKTVIFISHRLSTVSMADRIYVIDDGRLLEFGTHEELLNNNSLYKRMWDIQVEKYVTV